MLLRLFILCCFIFFSKTASAQNCLDEIYHNKLYSGSDDIINGKKWIYEKRYLGTPLLMENYWPEADILYNGFHYKGIVMNYDVYKNEIIIFHPEKGREKYVVISKDNLSGFSFTDTLTGRKHFYEYVELSGIRGKALYENSSVGKASFYIKPLKTVEVRSVERGQGEFSVFYEYYLDVGKGYTGFRTKSQLIKLFPTHNKELKRFIRKNNIKINNKHPENIITVLNFFDSLD
jgi:hypothetical protein